MALTYAAVAVQSVQLDVPRSEIEAFYRSNYPRAIAFARAYLKNLEDAEDAVSDASVKLLASETTPEHFMRALKQVVLNRLTRSKVEARLFASLDLTSEAAWTQSGQEEM